MFFRRQASRHEQRRQTRVLRGQSAALQQQVRLMEAGLEQQRAAFLAQQAKLQQAYLHQAAPAPAPYGLRSEDGRWWWDGQAWQPVHRG